MIDNITLYKAIEIPSLEDFYEQVKQRGATSFNFSTSEFGNRIRFKHKNLSFNAGNNFLKVEGSITKWYCGENISTLGLHDCHVAFNQLSLLLGIDLADFEVKSLEFAANFIMREEPKNYFEILGAHPKQKDRRIVGSTTLYYKGIERWMMKFYDKISHAQSKGNRMPVHHVLQNKNILRYEITFKGKLANQFKFENTLCQLLKPENYASILMRWYQEYKAINKVGVKQCTSNFTTPSEFKEFMVVTACHELGQDVVYRLIDEAIESKAIDSQSSRRIKKKVNEAYQKQPFTPIYNDLKQTNLTRCYSTLAQNLSCMAKELDDKVCECVNSQIY